MSTEPFHGLTPAEQERLAILSEECAEVIQIVNKIWRHGYYSTHPDNEDGPDNREMLETELGHVLAAQKLMGRARDIDTLNIEAAASKKANSIKKYLHHQV